MIVDSGADRRQRGRRFDRQCGNHGHARASWLRPSLVANGLDPENLAPVIEQKNYTAGDDALRRWKDIWAAGQGLQTIHAIEPVAVIVDKLEQEYRQATHRVAGRSRNNSARRSPC
jgi:hypothetical protein